MLNPQETIDLLAGSFTLISGKSTDEEWLKNFAAAINAESAICIRWTANKPESSDISSYGPYENIPAGWNNWANHIVNLVAPTQPVLMDAMLAQLKRPELNEANPLQDPQLLIGLVDWAPSQMFMLVHRDEHLGCWSQEEREHFQYLCELTRKSVNLHKDYARVNYMANSSVDILNSSPRGIIALITDGRIMFANTMGQAFLSAADGLRSREGKLSLKTKTEHLALTEYLTTASLLKTEQLNTGHATNSRTLSITRPSGHKNYQAVMTVMPLTGWRLEAVKADRMVMVTLYDPQVRIGPTAEQMRSYFHLTIAQARLAEQLFASENLTKASEELGISQNTARSHLRAIYAKMGINSQSELFSILAATIKSPTNSKLQNYLDV